MNGNDEPGQGAPRDLGDLIPRPDPSVITTEVVNQAKMDLRREMAALRELIETRINISDTRLATLDALLSQRPQAIHDAIEHLRSLHEERFRGIQQQFAERDVRGEQEKKASKEALDAALLAQKESVSQQNDANTTAATKSETSFTKQIDQIGTLIATLEKSLTDRITELKERIDRGEGQSSGVQQNMAEQHRGSMRSQGAWALALTVVWVAIAAISVLVATGAFVK